jgi:hypothetical protein
MFDGLALREAPSTARMKKAGLALLALCFVTAVSSGYRAYYQVRSLELRLTDSTLRAGSAVEVEASGSGRTTIDVRVELVQGARSETLAVLRVRGNDWAAIDPRPTRASQSVALTREQLSRFLAGPATLRATATGRPQWLRLPPPTVREVAVEIPLE